MSTSAQRAAAQQNGAKSKGPATAEGLARSSRNACKHNFFTSTALLPSEDREPFEILLASFTEEFKPVTAVELRCVREMADAEFRLNRVRTHAMEIQWKAMQSFSDSDTAASDAFQKLANEDKSLPLLDRYERQFQRQFQTALKTLLDLRKARARSIETHQQIYDKLRRQIFDEMMNAPTPGQLYGYDYDSQDEEATQQNEPDFTPQDTPMRS